MLSFRRSLIPLLIAVPATLCMVYILFADRGNAGAWGFAYNRLYIILTWALLFSGVLLLSRRPWSAAGIVSVILGGLWIGAGIKYQYLGSQLLAPDLVIAALSAETLLEMGLLPTLLVSGYLLLLIVSFWLEPPTTALGRKHFALGFASSATLFSALNLPVFYVDLQWTAQYKQTLPVLVQSIWRTQLEEPTQPHETSYCCFKADQKAEAFTETPNKKPNIIVILEESTFRPEQVLGFKPQGAFFQDAYPLKVYTAGGSTWVQEIAFLHGVAPPLYGNGWQSINLFAPGRLDGRIAHQLAQQGYKTKTIYPIAGRFYGGQRFHEQLGIQEFIDCKAMPECNKRRWNKLPDEIFFDEALKQLKLNEQPLFTFIATMRQHSPHDKDRAPDARRCKPSLSAKQCSIMLDYNERMKLSVTAYENFLAQLKKLPERTIVVAFGDHIPGDVAAYFKEADFYKQDRFRTYFNVWDSAQGYVTNKVLDGMTFETVDIAMLDALTLRYAGFASRYLTDKLVHMQACSGAFCGFDDAIPSNQAMLKRPQPPTP
ncbi:sulfatase-like hydrolase/transferase [Thiothrix lacustris]|uniref:sulfatase-like hydrolase/transferase n=1 Tax=Thiothrix lacustris TaxID=525917 RepID=UPI0027E472F3|nr:sulfatase-like hydrolase/transferase [Thiothrix lacustris]WMP16330.1 sulfatase-like hydrolase/transferase [Thiothrix lacustris]